MNSNHARTLWACVSPVLLVLTAAIVTGCDNCSSWTNAAILQSEEIGNKIITRLQSFERASGRPPDSLGELETYDSLPIDDPVAGIGKWSYYVRSDKSFILSFHCKGEYPIQYWDSRDNMWVLSQ